MLYEKNLCIINISAMQFFQINNLHFTRQDEQKDDKKDDAPRIIFIKSQNCTTKGEIRVADRE